MNNSNLALKYKDTYENVKRVDASALQKFVLASVEEITKAIEYWSSRKRQLTSPEQEGQRYACELEIIRLESILLARTSMTLDLFNITNMDEISESVEHLSTFTIPKKENKEAELPFVEETKEDATKVVSMVPDPVKPPYKTIIETCKTLIMEGKEEEALDYASSFFTTGNYIPKKSFEKAKPWAHARVVDLIANLTKSAKAELEKRAKEMAAKSEKVAKETSDTTEKKAKEKAKESETKVTEPVAIQEYNEEEVTLNIPIEDYDKFHTWLVENGCDPKEYLTEELLDPEKRKDFESFDIIATNKHYESLKEKGINVTICVYDDKEIITEEDFKNKSGLLEEELRHLSNLISKCMDYRGPADKKAENEDKINEFCNMFFTTRSKEDYPLAKELAKVIINRPRLVEDPKEVFALTRTPEYGLTAYSENKNTDMYDSLKQRAQKATDAEFESLKRALIGKLKGHIVQGKDEKGTLINKEYLYTRYHALSFLVNLRNEKQSHPINPTEKPAASVSNPAQTVSTKQPAAKELAADLILNLEKVLLTLLKNGGILEDAMRLEEVEKLKGKSIKDLHFSEGKETKLDSEDAIKTYITHKFNEAEKRYDKSRTSYPLKDMGSLIASAVETGVPVEEFVKNNINLVRRKDGSFIPVVDKNTKGSEISYVFSNEKDFETFVRKFYKTYEEVSEEKQSGKVYEQSEFKSLLDFESAFKKKITDEKLSLEAANNWAKEKVLNKVFSDINSAEPLFTSDRMEGFNSYVESITKPLYETVPDKEKNIDKIKNFLKDALKSADASATKVVTLVQDAKKFAIKEKIDANLKELLNLVLESAKENNKAIYDKYMSEKEALKKEELIPESSPVNDAEKVVKETTENNKVILKEGNGNKSVIKDLILSCKDVNTEEDLFKVLNAINKEAISIQEVTKAAKFIFNNNLKSLNRKEEEINSFVNKLYKNVTETKPIQETKTETPEVNEKLFDELSSANDKLSFKSALRKIIESYEDSAAIREKIISSIKASKKGHATKIASQPLSEMHKMIKKAYENLQEERKVE